MLGRRGTVDVRANAWALDKFACTGSVIDITTRQVRCLKETERRVQGSGVGGLAGANGDETDGLCESHCFW